MSEIHGVAKTVYELMNGVKYCIDDYQREFKWGQKQVAELVDDLSNKFLQDYQPGHPREKVAELLSGFHYHQPQGEQELHRRWPATTHQPHSAPAPSQSPQEAASRSRQHYPH